MKRTKTIIFLLAILILATAGIYYIWQKDREDPVSYTTEKPTKETIIKETVATGSIVPKEEVNIKPNISGVIDKVHVEAGDFVKAGDLIAEIKVVPNVSSLTNAKNSIDQSRNSVETAKLALDNQKAIYDRQKTLFEKGVIAANEFDLAQNAYNNALQRYKQEQVNLRGAQQNYDILRTGTTSGSLGKYAQTAIRSTVDGMVLDVPVKEGNQVIEANNFNEGTSIAVIADIKKMIFEGKVDESEVGKIKEGLPLEITVGAFDNKKFDAILDYVAPKGIAENGAIQFEIKGTLKTAQDSTFIRAGLSANASIILDKRDQVLSVKEALIQYDPKTKKPFVEVSIGDQEFERRDVELGLSNGIDVEIISGVSENDEIKVWNALKAPTGRGSYGG